jgi:pyridoxal phosphate enzyme (YggS family)
VVPTTTQNLRVNLNRVRERIAEAAHRASRQPTEVTLVAATKTYPPEVKADAVREGVLHFGENRVQEALAKIPRVAELIKGEEVPAPVWHMIGHLQTNKAKQAVELFSIIQSVDSVRLADTISHRAQLSRATQPLPVLLEVYFGEDPNRPGFRPRDLAEAVEQILEFPGIQVRGLMTVAPLGWDASATRGAFRRLSELRIHLAQSYPRVHWDQLSMGMSDDFELAVEEGSTMVRIGRALFGPREAG